MSLIIKTPVDPSHPQTHTFIIGINSYSHLPGGTGYAKAPPKFTLGLKQLTSPVRSAYAFADWILTNYNNIDAPLSTIEILLSDELPAYDPTGQLAGSATFANIQAAFEQWETRCDSHNDNVALFYFCGHGLDYETTTLLAEDFGANQNLPWDTSIDFNQTFYGMNDCRAQVQCYFIDACRETNREVLQLKGFNPRPLKTSQLEKLPQRAAPVLRACAQGEKAFAPVDGISYFTQELIRNFNGIGAGRKDGNYWRVTPESLSIGVGTSMMRLNYPCSNDGGVIHLYNKLLHLAPDPVNVVLNIFCNQPPEYSVSEVRLFRQPPSPIRYSVANERPVDGKLTREIVSGYYNVETEFRPEGFQSSHDSSMMIYPPEQDLNLE